MTERPIDQLLRDWRRSERADDDPAAEAALATLFAALPLEAPRAGFADRVIARAELERPLPLPVLPSAAGRWTAVFLAFASFSSLLLARWLLSVWSVGGGVGSAVRGGTDLVAELGAWLAGGLVFWQRLTDIGTWVARVVQTPEVAVSLLVSTLVAAAAFRGLQQLLAHERWAHVEN